jgi:phage terminase large subunit-like protein
LAIARPLAKKTKILISPDPVLEYAEAVLAGRIIAGPYVRGACKRHLRDLERTDSFAWDIETARRAFGYFSDVLRLNAGEWEGKPFELLPWQLFVIGSIFGWRQKDGTRRFRSAYIETGKGSGKSPLAAGIGLYGMTADSEPRAEIYAAATKKDQAQVLFRDAVAMVDQSPGLMVRITKAGRGENVWNLAYRQTGSFFRPISADDSQSGPRPHIALLDEVHEHRTNYMVEMMKAGQKWRRQPLLFMITNSGTDQSAVCLGYHQYATSLVDETDPDKIRDADSFFAFVCSLDANDDPMTDESCWPKANPSLEYGLPGYTYLRDQVAQARGIPGKESIVRRLSFCQWVESANPWLSKEVWEACFEEFDRNLLRGRKCWAGLDLSSTQDLTALVLLFAPTNADPHWRLVPYFWIPGEGVAERAQRDRILWLPNWIEKGYVEALPGRAINKLAVARRCAEIASAYDLQYIGFDRWRIDDFIRICDDEGISLPLVAHGQGFKDMAPAVDEFERMILEDKLRHDGNPVMAWCVGNSVVETDPAGNRKISKARSSGRVDGVVAAVMAAGQLGKSEETPEHQMFFI